jgi:hypothetical protein
MAEGIAFHEAQPALRRAQRRGAKPRRIGHNLLLRGQRVGNIVMLAIHVAIYLIYMGT